MHDPLRLDATAQLQLLETRRIGASELLELAVARGRAVADTVNAVVAADLEPARAAARYVDERRLSIHRAGGDPADELGLLGGLPLTVSDGFDVDGLPAPWPPGGIKVRACSDADVVGRMRAAGAVVWGKTHVGDAGGGWRTASRLYGRTGNPWDSAHAPGGGCGGAAAAMAAGIGALETGVDAAGGEARVAASLCGVFAHRPTFGLVSQRGRSPPGPQVLAEPDLAAPAPMARSARDLRLLLSVLAPAAIAARGQPAVLPGLRVGLWLEAEGFPTPTPVRDAIERWATALAAQGATVEAVGTLLPGGQLLRTFDVLSGGERARGLSPAAWRARRGLRPLARALASTPGGWAARMAAETASHRDWLRADEARARLKARMAAMFEVWDVVVLPAAAAAAPLDSRRAFQADALARWTIPATVLGLPATCLPAGFADGLPVGVQIMGPPGGDGRTLAVAEACEAEIGGFVVPPLEL